MKDGWSMNGNPGFMANALQASSIILQSFRIHPSSFILAHWDEGLELRFQVTLASEELQPDRHGPERLGGKPVDPPLCPIPIGGGDRPPAAPPGRAGTPSPIVTARGGWRPSLSTPSLTRSLWVETPAATSSRSAQPVRDS